jgi:hypothetical protein
MDMRRSYLARWAILGSACAIMTACGDKNYAAEDPVGPRPGPAREFDDRFDESVFGDGGLSLTRILNGESAGEAPGQSGSLPVNRFLWQASLDTLSFLPLASTDPYTGVIATDWGAAPNQPGERFKVTAYMVSPALSASSLKVAVYREVRDAEQGVWVPATVSPETPRKIEDAILTRARQIRIADVEGKSTG